MPDWFARLTDLAVNGTGREDRIAGIVHARVNDEGGVEFYYRVYRRGSLYRCASLDGGVHAVAGRDTYWIRRANGRMWTGPREHFIAAPDDYGFGTARPHFDRWTGDGFTRPTGPPVGVSFLGRAAWQVELAPPPHKPHPIPIVIDTETGLLLRQANLAFGTFHEWTTLDLDAELPDDLFRYHDIDRPARRYD